jgi:hypothetical protein
MNPGNTMDQQKDLLMRQRIPLPEIMFLQGPLEFQGQHMTAVGSTHRPDIHSHSP